MTLSANSEVSINGSRAACSRLFDDALDELDITFDIYYKINQYRPRCLFLLSWLSENDIHGKNVLVIGPQNRPLTTVLQKAGFRVEDINVTLSREFCTEPENQVMISDIEKTIYDLPGHYDLIICDDLLQHMVFPLRILQLLKGKLALEGIFILITRNVARMSMRLLLLSGRNVFPWLEQEGFDFKSLQDDNMYLKAYREYTFHEVRTLLSDAGFTPMKGSYIVGTKTINNASSNSVSFGRYLLSRVYYFLQTVASPLRSHIFIPAMKNIETQKV